MGIPPLHSSLSGQEFSQYPTQRKLFSLPATFQTFLLEFAVSLRDGHPNLGNSDLLLCFSLLFFFFFPPGFSHSKHGPGDHHPEEKVNPSPQSSSRAGVQAGGVTCPLSPCRYSTSKYASIALVSLGIFTCTFMSAKQVVSARKGAKSCPGTSGILPFSCFFVEARGVSYLWISFLCFGCTHTWDFI